MSRENGNAKKLRAEGEQVGIDLSQLPPIETTFAAYQANVLQMPEGGCALVLTVIGVPLTAYIFPMRQELAQSIGRQLLADRVIIPDSPTFPDGSPL